MSVYQISIFLENRAGQLAEVTRALADIAEQEKKLVGALKAMLGIYAKVRIVSPKSITRSEGKAVRVIDKRKI